jgi:hypothetical protein
MSEASTWSLVLGKHPDSLGGHHHDRWMVTYPRGLLAKRGQQVARTVRKPGRAAEQALSKAGDGRVTGSGRFPTSLFVASSSLSLS